MEAGGTRFGLLIAECVHICASHLLLRLVNLVNPCRQSAEDLVDIAAAGLVARELGGRLGTLESQLA